MTAGIYLITNKINNHMYVGGSIDIERRIPEHKRGACADNQAIDKAIIKYGKENFTYQIITELPPDWNIISKHEKYWVKFYNTFKDGKHYNLTDGGDFFIMSPESIIKLSEARKGIEPWNKGKPDCYSNETLRKMSEAHKGQEPWMKNKHHTEESKKKISKANSGENHPQWKDYARIAKGGFCRNKQQYTIRFNGKIIKTSISVDKLVKWFNENYPDEELVIDESIKLE